jgi:hypothetical protein
LENIFPNSDCVGIIISFNKFITHASCSSTLERN